MLIPGVQSAVPNNEREEEEGKKEEEEEKENQQQHQLGGLAPREVNAKILNACSTFF